MGIFEKVMQFVLPILTTINFGAFISMIVTIIFTHRAKAKMLRMSKLMLDERKKDRAIGYAQLMIEINSGRFDNLPNAAKQKVCDELRKAGFNVKGLDLKTLSGDE